jgi:hypothetical protein
LSCKRATVVLLRKNFLPCFKRFIVVLFVYVQHLPTFSNEHIAKAEVSPTWAAKLGSLSLYYALLQQPQISMCKA